MFLPHSLKLLFWILMMLLYYCLILFLTLPVIPCQCGPPLKPRYPFLLEALAFVVLRHILQPLLLQLALWFNLSRWSPRLWSTLLHRLATCLEPLTGLSLCVLVMISAANWSYLEDVEIPLCQCMVTAFPN